MIRERIGQILFFTGKIAFFSKICVFNKLLGLKEMILYLAQFLSEDIVVFRGPVFHSYFWTVKNFVSVLFFVWNVQTVFSWKSILKGPPLFVLLSVIRGPWMNIQLHLVALPASVIMSWLTKITKKLNMLGLEFLVLDLQVSNTFDPNGFLSSFI